MSDYFAAKESKEVASVLLEKAADWQNLIKTNGLQEKMISSWKAYHGAYHGGLSNGHQISFSGEQGELVNIAINHYRNIATHTITMATSTRPSLIARAVNSDYKSLIQTTLANSILDYYIREKKLEIYFKKAVEYAIVLGSGFIKMDWDANLGETYDAIEDENGEKIPLKQGDIVFSNLSPFDVLMDFTKEDDTDHSWFTTRTYKNKYDLIAKFPEFEDKIKQLKTKNELEGFRLGFNLLNEKTDDIPVYEFYHKKTPALPDGRYMMFLAEDIILLDGPLPYRVLTVFKISPSTILGTSHGYTPMFDLLPIQEGVNTLYSTILTNQTTFGVQNIWSPPGSDIVVSQLSC